MIDTDTAPVLDVLARATFTVEPDGSLWLRLPERAPGEASALAAGAAPAIAEHLTAATFTVSRVEGGGPRGIRVDLPA